MRFAPPHRHRRVAIFARRSFLKAAWFHGAGQNSLEYAFA